ncbi:MAG: extracellular solute-binding protein [Chloroflexi bacterium]|nr:extracellular solute-binding protein [Chloroflexota bacterium]
MNRVVPVGGGLTRRSMAMGAATGSAALLTACSLPGSGAGERAGLTGETVRVSFISRTAEQEAFTKRTADFNEQHPRIILEYTALPGDYPAVIRTNAAAGTLADVLYLQNLVFQGLAVSGDIQPLDALVKRDRINLKQWYDSGITGLKLDNKLFGLPARGQIQNCYLYYNKDAFQRAGIKEPDDNWKLDDLVNAADRLTSRGENRFGYGTQWGTYQNATAALRRWGGDLLTLDGKKSMVDRPEALQATQWHWELWHRKQIMLPKSVAPADFGSGAVAMAGQMLAGARGNVRTAVKDAFRWGMVMMPKGPTGQIGADTSIAPVSLNTRTKLVDQGWLVVQWFTDREAGVALGLQQTGSNTPGMRKDVYCDERLLNDPNYSREILERPCKAMETAGSVPYTVPANYRQVEVNAVVKQHNDAFLKNEAVPNPSTMRAFHQELQAALDLSRGGG